MVRNTLYNDSVIGNMKISRTRNSFIYLLIGVAVIAIFFTLTSDPLKGDSEMPISEVVRLAKLDQIASIEISGTKLTIVTNKLET